jgi:hypothetical protein
MVRAEVLQGVRQMRFEGLLERHERGELSQAEAAEMLGFRSGRCGAGATGCGTRGRRVCAIAGSASHRADGQRPRRSCACWGSMRSAMWASP